MILQHLTLQNFKQYRTLQLDFRDGLIGIIGKNGAGKSSIFEAVLLCLFGSTANTDKSFFKTSWADKKDNVLLELRLEVGGKAYRIERGFRGKALAPHAGLYDYKDDLIASGAKAVNESVAKLIGMDKEAFTRSIFSGQKELGILSNTKGEERKKMIRKMIGLDNLDQIQKLIRTDRNDLKKNIEGQKALLLDETALKAIKTDLKASRSNYKALVKEKEKKEKALNKQKAVYQKSKTTFAAQQAAFQTFSQLSQALAKYESLLETLSENQTQLNTTIQSVKKLKKTQQALKKPVAQHLKNTIAAKKMENARTAFSTKQQLLTKKEAFLQSLADIEAEVKQIPETRKSIDTFSKQLASLQSTIADNHKNKALLEEKAKHLNNEKGRIEGNIADRKTKMKRISELGKDSNCPTCFQPLQDIYEETLINLSNEIAGFENEQLLQIKQDFDNATETLHRLTTKNSELEQQSRDLQSRLTVATAKLEELSRQKSRIDNGKNAIAQINADIKALGKIDFDETAYNALQATIEDFNPTYIDYQVNEAKVEQLPDLQAQLATVNDRIKMGENKIKEQQKAIKTVKYSETAFNTARDGQAAAETLRDHLQTELNALNNAVATAKTQVTRLEQQLSSNEANVQIIQANLEELQTMEQLNGLFQSFKTFILDKIKPTITNYAGDLFQRITKGRYESIEVNDNFDFLIYENGVAYPITRFSGGEIDLANLCLRIGISKAIAELSGSTEALNFLGFDEIFGSQDEDRRMEILLALETLKEQYRQIYIITHVDTVKDYFPNILQVTKTGDGAVAAFQ